MTSRIQSMIERARQTTLARVITAFGESRASSYALALAFAAFMAMFPLILGALSIIGFAVRDPHTESRVHLLILQVFPGSAQPELRGALTGVKESAGWMSVVSLGGLIWSASSIFATMEFALTEIFGTNQRDIFRQKVMGLLMMVVLVVAIVVLLGVNAVAAIFPFAWITSFVAGAAVMVTLLVLLYRLVPNRTFTLPQVLPGALLAGVLIEVLTLAFPLYARLAGGFNTYGAQFGLFFLLATWFYLLSELLLLGAVYNRFRMGRPVTLGLIASPAQGSRAAKRPVEAIKEEQAAGQ